MSKPVLVELGGKARRLRYDWTALSDIKQRLKLANVADVLSQRLDYDVLVVMLWAGLTHEDENLTERQVGRWVSGDNSSLISDAMAEALTAAFPPPENGANPPMAAAPRPIGTPSSPMSSEPEPSSP